MHARSSDLEAKLRSQLSELEDRLQKVNRDQRQAHSADSSEQAQERENDEVIDVIGDETRVAIAAIKSALKRIEDGDYGNCENCGGAIADGRLEAVPEATLCIDCAN